MKWISALWQLPAAVPMWAYLLLFWGLRFYRLESFESGVATFRVDTTRRLMRRLWSTWAGHSAPFAIVLHPAAGEWTIRHERRHLRQWEVLGVLFLVVWPLLTVSFGYRDNPLEVDARSYESAP